ncbi:hypothetical protein FJY93_04390 [Candidatus Kaiserbacteria bacterium]|nr:hypothetical protein [Candidatus Kaiserbacteria bacterium]
MLPYRDSRLTKIALSLFFVAVVLYGYFEVHGLLFGPRINIDARVVTSKDQYVLIGGHVERIDELSVNGAPIPVTIDGVFEVPYLLAPGNNQIIFDARDSYGNSTSQMVEIVYIPPTPSAASSTPTTIPSDMGDTAPSSDSPETTITEPLPPEEEVPDATETSEPLPHPW